MARPIVFTNFLSAGKSDAVRRSSWCGVNQCGAGFDRYHRQWKLALPSGACIAVLPNKQRRQRGNCDGRRRSLDLRRTSVATSKRERRQACPCSIGEVEKILLNGQGLSSCILQDLLELL